ncbi:MAG: fluoride efflux transporter CrcB [Burkholderiaceae bacterium]
MSAITLSTLIALWIGSMIGATLRWLAQILLNPLLPTLPLGTLLVNVVGGCVMGVAIGAFAKMPDASPEWRTLVFTGLLGGLTTFSSFTGESMLLLQEGRPGWAFAHASAHVFGALVACFAGYALVQKLS